jgi:hypothetical protein
LRIGVPCVTGVWAALLLFRSGGGSVATLVVSAYFVLFGLALLLLRLRGPGRAERPYAGWQSVCLGLSSLGSALYLFRQLWDAGGLLAGLAAVAGGVGAMALFSLEDWRIQDIARRRYSLVLLPWLMACELGLLGGWLLVYGFGSEGVARWDQLLLSVVVLLIMGELLIFLRWVVPASPGDALRKPLNGAGERATILNNLRSWGGRILPAALLILAITNEGVFFALLAWLLVLAGHAIRYYLLTSTLYRGRVPAAT